MIVEFYRLEDGTKPAGIFIKAVEDKKLKAKIIRSTKLLEQYGAELTEPDSKHLEDGIFELRTIQEITLLDVYISLLWKIKP